MENVAANHHAVDIENNYSEEDLLKDFEEGIQSKLKIIVRDFTELPSEQDRIICHVDPFLHKMNPAAYSTNFVVIGPLRYYEFFIHPMEIRKRLYLNSFLQRPENKASLNDFFKLIRGSAEGIHGCYEEANYRSWDFLNNDFKQNLPVSATSYWLFIEMVLVDAIFIIELLLRVYNKVGRGESQFVYEGPGKLHDIKRDLFLAQNQLPFFILKGLYNLAFGGNPDFPSFLTLVCHFFSPFYTSIQHIESLSNKAMLEDSKHFTDLLRTLYLPFPNKEHCGNGEPHYSPQLANEVKDKRLPSSKVQEESEVRGEYLYSAVLLREAGVKFKVSPDRCLLDIEFNDKNGELRIPPLRLDELSESFFRNLMAWEQCYYPHDTYICNYVFLMQYLIKSVEDVDLLVRRRIFINELGTHEAVVTLFNQLCKHVKVEKNHYSGLFTKLNAYHAIRHHSWIAILKLQYFSTLWTGVATIAAVILLVLTLIQTICSVISALPKHCK